MENYSDNIAQGLDIKESVSVATVENITLNPATNPIDNVTLSTKNRVLVKNQSNAKENGIYEAFLPLKSFADFQKFRWDELKEIRFKILEETHFEIGEFQLIEFRGNPKKPTQWKGI